VVGRGAQALAGLALEALRVLLQPSAGDAPAVHEHVEAPAVALHAGLGLAYLAGLHGAQPVQPVRVRGLAAEVVRVPFRPPHHHGLLQRRHRQFMVRHAFALRTRLRPDLDAPRPVSVPAGKAFVLVVPEGFPAPLVVRMDTPPAPAIVRIADDQAVFLAAVVNGDAAVDAGSDRCAGTGFEGGAAVLWLATRKASNVLERQGKARTPFSMHMNPQQGCPALGHISRCTPTRNANPL